MTTFNIVSIITGIFGLVLFVLNLIREISVYLDIKSVFICKNCGTLNEKVSNLHKCKRCHRDFKIKYKEWTHRILHRVTWIQTERKSEILELNIYLKISKIEMAISITAIVLILTSIIFNVIC